MGMDEFRHWVAYRRKNGPLGWRRLDHLAASIAFWIFAMNTTEEGRADTKPDDFRIQFAKPKPPLTPEEEQRLIVAKARLWVQAMGGIVHE